MDKGDAGGLTHTKGRKCTMSDRGDIITWTGKKNKVSVPIRICFTYGVYISIEGNRFSHQASCWEEVVNSENIC